MAKAFLRDIKSFRLDRQQGQPVHLVIAVEAAGMLPQVRRVADDFGVPCYAAGGFDSSTGKHELADYLSGFAAAELLHIGDHDPSGVHILSNLAEDVKALAEDMAGVARGTLDIRFSRLAVTPAHIDQFNLPTAFPKASDNRSFEGNETVQAEALPPEALADIVRAGITTRIDPARLAAVMAQEERRIRTMSRDDIAALFRGISD